MRKIKKTVLVFFLTLLLAAAFLKCLIFFYESAAGKELKNADAIVVLGGGISKENLPTTSSYERVMAASQLYFKGYSEKMVLCGGLTEPHYIMTEARMMEKILKDKNISVNYVLENDSVNTYTSALNVKKNFPYLKKIIIVTTMPHNLRARLAFEKQGFEAYDFVIADGIYFKQNFYKKSRQVLYETAAIIYYKAKGRI